jgi:predicted ATP-dependent serine protease
MIQTYLRPHVANWLGKCKTCNYWNGKEMEDYGNNVCNASKERCVRFYVLSNSEKIYEDKKEISNGNL